MYNAKQKEEFLNTISNENSYKSYRRVFNNISSLEKKLKKDISQMNIDEVLIVLDLNAGTRVESIGQTMSLLKAYVNWCIKNGKTFSENNFDKIDRTEVDKTKTFRSKYVKDPEEFEDMIKAVYDENYDYNETIDKPKELCIRLCYEEFDGEEIVQLKKTDIDFENEIICSPLYPNVKYKASKRILELCEYCINTDYVEYAGRYKTRIENLCVNDYVIRQRIGTLRGETQDRTIHKSNITRRVKEFSDLYVDRTGIYKDITEGKLRESHVFYRIYSSGNPEEYIENNIREEILEKNPDISKRQMYDRMHRIKTSYRTWEETFH